MRFLFTLILLTGLSAEAKWAEDACQAYLHSNSSLGATFVTLQNQGQLIHQHDPRLAMRALLVPNGGLCVSTCGVNVIRAVYHYATGFGGPVQAFPDEYIQRVVNTVWVQRGHDARLGLAFHAAATAMQTIALQEHLNMQVAWEPLGLRAVTWSTLKPAHNELVMVTIESGLNPDGTPSFHALVVSGVNLQNGFISWSDPQMPNKLQVSSATQYLHNGLWTLRMDFRTSRPTALTGVIVDVLRITVPPLYLPPWSPAY